MSTPCPPYDLRDLLLEELTAPQQREVRLHLKTCAACNSELDALRSTHAALLTLRDEDIPQRIGFVSDKVFEPSPVLRWFTGVWTSAARLGFVSAALLSIAILVHATRPAPQTPAAPTISQAEIDRRVQQAVATQVAAQLQPKIDAAVAQAVAETEKSAQKRTTEVIAAAQRRLDMERTWAASVQLELSRYNKMKQNGEMVRASFGGGAQ
jgi:hypothetical protein